MELPPLSAAWTPVTMLDTLTQVWSTPQNASVEMLLVDQFNPMMAATWSAMVTLLTIAVALTASSSTSTMVLFRLVVEVVAVVSVLSLLVSLVHGTTPLATCTFTSGPFLDSISIFNVMGVDR